MNLTNINTSVKGVFASIWKYREAFLIAAIAILIYLLVHKSNLPPSATTGDPATLKALKETKDKNGQLEVTISQQLVEKNQLGHTIDSLAKALKIKPRFIQGATIYITKIDTQYRDTGRIKLVVIGKDTVHIVQQHDHWVDISAFAYTNPKYYNLDHIDYQSRDSLWMVESYKNPLFGRPTYDVTLRSSNPYNHIIAGSSIKVREKVPWLVVGAGIMYQPFPVGTPWNVGIFAGYPIFTLKR
jgi:hypothetical protein